MFLFNKKNKGNPQSEKDEKSVSVEKKKQESIKDFITLLKEQYAEGLISEKTFKEALAKNEEALAREQKNKKPKQEKKKIGDKKEKLRSDKGKKESENLVAPREKTVGEILKEEGVIHEEEEKGGKIKVERELDLNKMLMSIEKLTAEVDALRDVKFQADERIKEIAESIGEMRSLIFQRDSAIKELQMKIERLEDAVSGIKPEKIAQEMRKREQELMEESARIEKLGRISEDLARKIKSMERILENVRSMENLANISREIEEKLSRIEELKSGTERDAEKSEKMYLEMERRTQELIQIRETVRRLDELSKELVKSMDEEKIKTAGLASKEDLQKALETALKPPIAGKTLEDKINEKQEIESLLKNLELQYKKGIISKESFDEVSEKNRALMQILDKEVKESEAKKAPQTIFDWLTQIENELKEMQIRFSFIEKNIKQIGQNESRQIIKQPEAREQESFKASNENEAEDIKMLMAEIEDQYREGIISERAYSEIKEKNRKRLSDIRNELFRQTIKNEANKSTQKTGDNETIESKLNELRDILRNSPVVIE